MTREEAIEVYNGLINEKIKAAFEFFAPELRESEEEDERIIKTLQEYVKNRNWNLNGPSQAEVLAWLEKQKEQKPVEWEDYKDKVNIPYCSSEPAWSEEDTDMLNCCISSIEEAKENRYAYKETDGDTSYDREIDWLKSLRPSWKPSEEQMDALERASTNKYLSAKQFDILVSLYEQLKKL